MLLLWINDVGAAYITSVQPLQHEALQNVFLRNYIGPGSRANGESILIAGETRLNWT
jgi:hypothetical protein